MKFGLRAHKLLMKRVPGCKFAFGVLQGFLLHPLFFTIKPLINALCDPPQNLLQLDYFYLLIFEFMHSFYCNKSMGCSCRC